MAFTNFKQVATDSKYIYMLNQTSNWIYRKKRRESDLKLVTYMEHDKFMTHDEIIKESRKFKI